MTEIERNIQQIVDILLLNGTLTECPGLVHGKMGIAIFFFRYAQYSNNELFADYAMDLIGEIFDFAIVSTSGICADAGTGMFNVHNRAD